MAAFAHVYMGLKFECIHLGIVFTNEDIFCLDHMIMYIYKKKKKVKKNQPNIDIVMKLNRDNALLLKVRNFVNTTVSKTIYFAVLYFHINYAKPILVQNSIVE